jgi:acetyl/propionyl-CoA carboxylase alpha subunit
MAFKQAGCAVDMVCPADHPFALTADHGRLYPYHSLAALRSFRNAMDDAQPEIVVPCDDLARAHLHEIYKQDYARQGSASALCILLERSLGDPLYYSLINARSLLITFAQELQIATPETAVIATEVELKAWIARFGLPAVLKTDGTSGGVGVRIVESEREALRAFELLNAPPRMLRAAKRAVVDRDKTLLIPWFQRQRPVVNVQRFLPSRDATISVACWRGTVLASITAEVLRTWKPKGPSSVIRIIDNSDMLLAAQKLASRLKLSGLYGFDFVLENVTGKAYLIEMNPRATQTCHIPLGTGHALPIALAASAVGESIPESASITDRNVIALFPLEWQNDAASPFLHSAYHDVPWEEPKLVQSCVKSRMRLGGRLTYENLNKILAHMPWRQS